LASSVGIVVAKRSEGLEEIAVVERPSHTSGCHGLFGGAYFLLPLVRPEVYLRRVVRLAGKDGTDVI